MKDKIIESFEILCVPYPSPKDVVKKSFRRLALEIHPDQNPNDKKAEENFKLINAAWEYVSSLPDNHPCFMSIIIESKVVTLSDIIKRGGSIQEIELFLSINDLSDLTDEMCLSIELSKWSIMNFLVRFHKNKIDFKNGAILICGVKTGDVKIVSFLIEHGATYFKPIELINKTAESNNAEILKLLCEHFGDECKPLDILRLIEEWSMKNYNNVLVFSSLLFQKIKDLEQQSDSYKELIGKKAYSEKQWSDNHGNSKLRLRSKQR